jgi:hypothetical protein
VYLEQKATGHLVMRAKAKRKERDELEEERDRLLRVYVAPRSCAHKRACIGLIAEVDACLDDEYNADQAEKEYPRMHFNANLANTYNCVTFYLFTPEQIRCIRDVCMRRMPADRDQVWIRLPAKLKLKRFTWEEEILCFLYRLERQSYERDARKKIGVSSVTHLLLP